MILFFYQYQQPQYGLQRFLFIFLFCYIQTNNVDLYKYIYYFYSGLILTVIVVCIVAVCLCCANRAARMEQVCSIFLRQMSRKQPKTSEKPYKKFLRRDFLRFILYNGNILFLYVSYDLRVKFNLKGIKDPKKKSEIFRYQVRLKQDSSRIRIRCKIFWISNANLILKNVLIFCITYHV